MKKDSKSSTKKRPEILIAEDSPTQAAQIKHLLESHNYNVKVAIDGEEAIDKLSKHKPSLVISDILMPEMNGYELCKKIKSGKNTEDIPVILLTRLSDPEEIIEGLSCGADSFITKPYNEKHLLSNIEKILSAENGDDYKKVPFGVQILFNGEKRTIQAEQQNVIKLMLDIYEGAIYQNEKLIQTQEELRLLNERLESLVEDRTADLAEEIKLSNQIADRLKESEEKFRKIFHNHAAVKLLIDPASGSIIDANKAAADYYGWSCEELKRMKINQINTLTPEEVKKEMEKAISQKNIHFEFRHQRKDGSIRDVEVWSSKIEIGNKEVLHSIVHDITDRKQAENALRESEQKFKSIMENSPDAIFIADQQGKYLYTNKAVTLMLGFTPEEMQSKTIIDLSPSDKTDEYFEIFKRVMSEGRVFTEIELLKKDGNFVSTDLNSVLIPGGLIYGSCRDITERKNAEEALQQSLAFSESLLKTIPFGMDIVSETGTILFQSENFRRICSEEAIGRKCWELYRDDKEQCTDCPLTRGITVGETEAYESHGVLGNRIFEINHTGMMFQGKKAMLEIFQDITERKENEEELIKAKEKAEESDRLKTAFLHNISHEIRTPMNAIVGFSLLLGEPGLDAQAQKSYIETIMQSSNHLLSIITDIIDISNIEANIVKIARNGINVNITLNSICNQFQLKAGEKKIKLVCKTILSDSEALVIADNTKLTQILTSLLSNAIKFTDEGTVELSCRNAGNFLEFSVSDTGIGIPAEYHGRIFDRFYQVQNAVSRLYEGTGLGLAISKAYVDLMGGKIWVTSEPAKGTTFTFTIPYEKQIIAEKPLTEKSVPDTFTFKKKMKILVAEDIDSNFLLLTYFFRGTDAEIIRAVNGKVAVEKCLTEKNIDLILMDIKMPEMDGYTAVKQIREANITIPIIAQTAYSDDKEKAIENGCNGFITKPFDKKRLIKVLAEFI